MGSNAFRRACFKTTTLSRNPLARAVRIYSNPNTSNMLERVIRAIMDKGIVPTATQGKIRCHKASRNTLKFPVIKALNVTVFEAKVTIVPHRPLKCSIWNVSANGGILIPDERRPEGGIQKGVPLSVSAKI